MIGRPGYLAAISDALDVYPVVTVLGARQVGKSTLARELAENRGGTYFDLEDPRVEARLSSPMIALENLDGLIVLDEVQRKPELFPVLRVLADRPGTQAKFLLLGSASPRLVADVSETLAGRTAFVEVDGFDLGEVGHDSRTTLWLRGGFPDSFLAKNDDASLGWRENFIRTFLERDIPSLGISIPAPALRRFWTMVAHQHGGLWNASELARSVGTTQPTARRYLDLLTGTFVVRQLQPWFENISKRQVKSPKVFIRDTGLLHALLNIPSTEALQSHPKLGASWEGFVIDQLLRMANPRNAYFWATHAGAELDLMLLHDGRRIGIEVKYADAPRTTKSMHVARRELKLDDLLVVYPGDQDYELTDEIRVVSLRTASVQLAGASSRSNTSSIT